MSLRLWCELDGLTRPPVTAQSILAAAEVLARQVQDSRATALDRVLRQATSVWTARDRAFLADQRDCSRLVIDCFLAGAAAMLKALRNDVTPEAAPVSLDRLAELLQTLKEPAL